MQIKYADGIIKISNVLEIIKNPDVLNWQMLRDKIEIFPLYEEKDGVKAAFLRFGPGAVIPDHLHTGYEHIFVLKGLQLDQFNSYTDFDFVIFTPNSSHKVISEQGGLAIAIWQKPIKFL